MSRDSDIVVLSAQSPAASAATTYVYFPVPAVFRWVGFGWSYQTAEANTDNTLDFVLAADSEFDGTFDGTTLHTNANAFGLLDSAAIGETMINYGDAASGGGAAVAVTPTEARLAQGATIRAALTTAGSSTVPAINFHVFGYFLAPNSDVGA